MEMLRRSIISREMTQSLLSLAGAGRRTAETVALANGVLVRIRPLEPDDDARYPHFLSRISAEDRRYRFFSAARISERQIHGFTHYDPENAQALVALGAVDGQIYGVARLHRTVDDAGEFAVLVRSDLKGLGLGRALMERIIAAAEPMGIRTIFGLILRENSAMQDLARDLGFELRSDPADPELLRAELSR